MGGNRERTYNTPLDVANPYRNGNSPPTPPYKAGAPTYKASPGYGGSTTYTRSVPPSPLRSESPGPMYNYNPSPSYANYPLDRIGPTPPSDNRRTTPLGGAQVGDQPWATVPPMAMSAPPMLRNPAAPKTPYAFRGTPYLNPGRTVAPPTAPTGSPMDPDVLNAHRRGMYKSGVSPDMWRQAGNAAYDNIAPNDGLLGTRRRAEVANVYDPQSWTNLSNSPDQIREQIATRTAGYMDELRNERMDPYGARQQNYQQQYSPLNGDGLIGLNSRQPVVNDRSEFDASRAAMQARLVQRAAAGGVSPERQRELDNIQSLQTAKYNNYNRNARNAGMRPMGYQEWVAAGSAQGEESAALADQAFMQRAQGEADRQSEGAYRRQMLMGARGLPVYMPSDPVANDRWMQSMAVSGNRNAGKIYSDSMNNAHEMSVEQLRNDGQNYRNNNEFAYNMDRNQSTRDVAKIEADSERAVAQDERDAQVQEQRRQKSLSDAAIINQMIEQGRASARSKADRERSDRETLRKAQVMGLELQPHQKMLIEDTQAPPPAAAADSSSVAPQQAKKPVNRVASDTYLKDTISAPVEMNDASFDTVRQLGDSFAAAGIGAPTREEILEVTKESPLGVLLSDKARVNGLLQDFLKQQDEHSRDYYTQNHTYQDWALGFNMDRSAAKTYQSGRENFNEQNSTMLQLFKSLIGEDAVKKAMESYYKTHWVPYRNY